MTNEALDELHEKFSKAISIKRKINDLNKILERRKDIKLWSVCLYYDEECETGIYADLALEDLYRFIDEFIIKEIRVLEQEFAAL